MAGITIPSLPSYCALQGQYRFIAGSSHLLDLAQYNPGFNLRCSEPLVHKGGETPCTHTPIGLQSIVGCGVRRGWSLCAQLCQDCIAAPAASVGTVSTILVQAILYLQHPDAILLLSCWACFLLL